jgi:hypothetical protein
VEGKLPLARERKVEELLYLIRGGVKEEDQASLSRLCEHQFRAGHNIYHCEFADFLHVMLILFGESGRREFLDQVGESIDEFGELIDREAWREQLSIL